MSKTYKVIKIINEYQLVVNVGKTQGIHKGDTLEIYVPGEKIHDPDTNELLGTLDFIKAYIIVKDIFEKMCICENKSNILSPIAAMSILNSPQRLNVDSKEISGGILEDSKIQVGDFVRKS